MSVGGTGMRHHGMGIGTFAEQQPHEITQHGYLNRRCIHDPNTKKKDKSWQTFWFNIKGSLLEFYRVDGIRAKPTGEPPPRDVLPPPNKIKMKVGFVDIDGAVVEVDYTSQENVDLQKRRKHLFRVELSNRTEFMFQAPSDDRRKAWVIAMQNASRRRVVGEEDGAMLSHSIRTARCSIKQRSVHNVHSLASQSLNTSASLDDPDYVDFSLAETMVSRDPRLRALKKRLQAKKQLLTQLNKMYTSFLGGNVAALYDETLLHQQHEPPTMSIRSTNKENGENKVVHRKMSLPDAQPNGPGTAAEGAASDEDRRASTGDFNVPIVTSLSPGVDSVNEGLETQLLMDYYLIPGADWSLLKKGDTVKVLGKAGGDGRWYRCMAQRREINVKIPDLSLPPASIVNDLLPGAIIGKGSTTNSSSRIQPQVTVEEESLDDVAREEERDKQLSLELEAAAVEETDGGLYDGDKESQGVANGGEMTTGDTDGAGERVDAEEEGGVIHSELENGHHVESSEKEVKQTDRNSHSPTGRSLSYMLAVEKDTLKVEEENELPSQSSDQREASSMAKGTRPKKKGGKLSRSTSSPSAGARIRLQQTMGFRLVPGLAQSPVLQSRFSVSSNRGGAGFSASFPGSVQGEKENTGPSRMAKLLESETKTGSYNCPLVGCIPTSALKCFAERDETKRFSMSPVSSNSPSLGFAPSATSLNSLAETPTHAHADIPVSQQNGTTTEQNEEESVATEPTSGSGTPIDVGGDMGVVSEVSITITGDEGNVVRELEEDASRQERMRAQSLPPQLFYSPSPPSTPEHDRQDQDGDQTSLDRSPSHLRRSPGFKTPEPADLSESQPSKTAHESGRQLPDASIGSLFDSGTGKRSIFKKLFGKKSTSKPRSMTDVNRAGARSPSPNLSGSLNPSLLKSVLLGKEVEDEFSPQERVRVSSISGRPVRQDGVGIVIGNESSSESEDEDDNRQDDSAINAEVGTKKFGAVRHLSGDLGTSSGLEPISPVHIPRSVSEHESMRRKGAISPDMAETKEAKAKSASMKRPAKNRIASFKKSPKRSAGKKRPVSDAYQIENESTSPMSDISAPKLTGIFRQPPRGELRMVYLDPSEKYGFRLQSYGRVHEQGKVLQTFVQNVIPGSVSFMAGLYPGDAIVAVNGENVKYAPIDKVYEAIKNASKGPERVALQVVFADGVTRLDCMRKSDEVKTTMKEKQQKLRELLATERLHSSPPVTPLPSPQHITLAQDLPAWSETTPTTPPGPRPFPYNRHLNQVVSLHGGTITSLACDSLVVPLSSCFRQESECENVLYQFIRSGGEELLDELSLARQGRVGDIIKTKGHKLNAQNLYHCVFGDLEESLQSCCRKALEMACEKELHNVVFWVDGFASISVSPHLILEAVRQWLHEGTNGGKLERIVFSAKANISLIEKHMDDYFPLLPFASPLPNGKMENEVVEDEMETGASESDKAQDGEASKSDKAQDGVENEASESDKAQDGMKNETTELEKVQDRMKNETSELEKAQDGVENATVESEKLDEKVSDADKKDLVKLHERVSVVSMDGIGIDLGNENVTRVEEPIPEDMEPELDTDDGKNEPVSVDNIDLELQGVDDEISNIESILQEMQLQEKKSHFDEQAIELVDDEDPLGLLSFLGNRTQPQEIQVSASLSAHTSPTHVGVASETSAWLSRSLPLLDDSPLKLNPKREESEV